MRARLPGPPGRAAPRNGLHMPILGATLGDHQIIEAMDLIQVRTFGPGAAGARPDHARLGQQPTRGNVEFALLDAPAGFGGRGGGGIARGVGAGQIDAAVVVEEERRIDPGLLDPDRLGPGAGRVVGGDVKVTRLLLPAICRSTLVVTM